MPSPDNASSAAPAASGAAGAAPIEVVQTAEFYILLRGEHSLWWSRRDGGVTAGSAWDLAAADDPVCLGVCQALVGAVQTSAGGEWYLLLVRDSASVGRLPGGCEVRKVVRVVALPLTPAPAEGAELAPCAKHGASAAAAAADASPATAEQRPALARTWGLMKTVTTRVTAATAAAAQSAGNQVKERVPGLRRPAAVNPVLDELLKLFNDSDAFFFSPDGDLTNSLRRRRDGAAPDERFFWNAAALAAVRALPSAAAWVQPLVQGHVHVSELAADDAALPAELKLTLISRRSRFRAGTRYRRRGLDPDGHVANYVETEQIVTSGKHHLSFVQVRGSVPVFWAQPGYKYRPPPRIERDPVQTAAAFRKHMDAEIERYGAVHAISLVDQLGRESVIAEAYLDQALAYDSEKLTFTAFDFHEHCRGLRFENVSLLLAAVSGDLQRGGFTWADDKGVLCRQAAVFRTSCMDCLDRTNVVQTALGKAMLEVQLAKLGVSTAAGLPAALRAPFQQMWADTGDALSRQYAGTGALKADFTRTGERRWTGMMRDGVNSASRYYLNRFRDAGRQAAIEASLGRPPAEPETLDEAEDEPDEAAAVERVRQLLADCQRLLVPDSSEVLGAWGLIDADPEAGDPSETELDTILVLTPDSYYVACYDDETDRIVSYQRVPLADLESLQLGPVETARLSRAAKPTCLRLCYQIGGETGYFHQLRATPLRFFNNVPVSAGSAEERADTLRALAAALVGACAAAGRVLPLTEGKLERRRSRAALGGSRRRPEELVGSALRTAGTKAVSSVAAWIPQRLRLWDGQPAPTPATEGNSPEGEVEGQGQPDLIIGSAGIIARPATLSAAAAGQQVGTADPETAAEGSEAAETQPVALANGTDEINTDSAAPITSNAPAAPAPVAGETIPESTGPVEVGEEASEERPAVPEITVSGGRPTGGLSLLGSALSPLASPARDSVLVGFSRLARGVQRLGSAATSPSTPRRMEISDLLRQRIAASKTQVTIL